MGVKCVSRHQRDSAQSPFVFVSERGAPLSAPGFSRMIERAAIAAGLGIKAHAHMLRHACGYKLAKRRPRHACDPSVSGTSQHPEYDALYRVGTAAVQGIFLRLKGLRGVRPLGLPANEDWPTGNTANMA
jgi:integrase